MKQLIIKELHYQNFKMLENFKLILGKGKTVIEARNGQGKSTLFDGFSWLLFDKDSKGKQIGEDMKTKIDGVPLQKVKHSVTGTFSFDGISDFELKKEFYEKWVTKRGSIEEHFDGHTTDYYIDGVKVAAKKYKEFVSDIVAEDVFKLLTNPMYFNVNLDASKRREMLFEIFGDLITDEDIISLRSDYSIVKKVLEKQSLVDAITSTKKDANQVNKDMQLIPAQIKENQNKIFGSKKVDEKEIEKLISESNKVINDLQARIQEVKSGGLIAKKNNELLEIKGEIKQIENENIGSGSSQEKLNKAKQLLSEIENELYFNKSKVVVIKNSINNLEEQLINLRNEKAELMIPKDFNGICSSCGSPISEEKKMEHLNNHNNEVAEKLKVIQRKGIAAKKEQDELKLELSSILESIYKLNERKSKGEAYLDSIKDAPANEEYKNSERYKTLERKLSVVTNEIYKLEEESEEIIKELTGKLQTANNEHNKNLTLEIQQEVIKQSNDRIEELKKLEIELSEKYGLLSERLNVLEEFSNHKSELIESRMSERFKDVSFKLFEKQVNGEIKPVCKTVYGKNKIAFDEGLNNGHQILSGLEIIKVFSEYYGLSLPIFIDNAEGITEDYECNAQRIELRAVRNDAMTITGGVAQTSLKEAEITAALEYDDLDELF